MNFLKRGLFTFFCNLVLAMTLISLIPLSRIMLVEAASIKLNKSNVDIIVGENYQLKIIDTKDKVKWSTSNKKIANVTKDGLVTGVKPGTVYITAYVADKEYKCRVNILSTHIKASIYTIGINESITLEIINLPKKYTMKDVKWESSNKDIAVIDKNGIVTSKDIGSSKITATFGDYKLKCRIDVKATPKNLEDNLKNLKFEYGDFNNQNVCIVSNSNLNMNAQYRVEFYNIDDNLVSVSNYNYITLLKNNDTIIYVDKIEKDFTYYKLKFTSNNTYINEVDISNQVDINISEMYDYCYEYNEFIAGNWIKQSDTRKLFDLHINNRTNNRIFLNAYVVYYKHGSIVNVQNFNQYSNTNLDIGETILKNPITFQPNIKNFMPDYDNYRIIYNIWSF